MADLFQVVRRKDRAEGASWEHSSSLSGRAGTWLYCTITMASQWGSKASSHKEIRVLCGRDTALSALPQNKQDKTKLFRIAEDLDLSLMKWIGQDKRQRLLGHEGFRDEQFLTSPPTLGTRLIRMASWGFPGGAVVGNLPANAGDMGLSPGLGRSHMPQSN